MKPLAVSEPILEAEKCDSKLGFLTWSRLSQFQESLVVVFLLGGGIWPVWLGGGGGLLQLSDQSN